MSKDINFSGILNFSEIDLTAPDEVIEEILVQLPEKTNNIIFGKISPYTGQVTSYTEVRPSLAGAMGVLENERFIDIQNKLGKIGEDDKKFECFLYTSVYPNYKYRLFFMKYGIANYPVQFTLEESIARNIKGIGTSYIVTCDTRDAVEELLDKIFNTKKVIDVMQELIRIHQAKKATGYLSVNSN